jgi:hypothetical protein
MGLRLVNKIRLDAVKTARSSPRKSFISFSILYGVQPLKAERRKNCHIGKLQGAPT